MQGKGLIKNTIIYALGDIVPKLLAFISFPIITKYLSPDDYGIVNYVNSLGTFLLIFGLLCINTYFLVYYYRCEDEVAQKKMLGNLSLFIVLYNIGIIILFLLFGDYFFSSIGSKIQFYPYILFGVLANFFNIFSILPLALYRVLEKPLFLTIVNILRSVVTLIITLVLIIVFHYKAIGVLSATLVVNFLFVFVFLYAVRKHIIWNLNLKQLKRALAFSLPLVPGSLAYYVTMISDRILIEKYLNLNDLGIYSTAATLALILNIFSYGAYKAFEPYIFKHWGTTNFKATFEKIHNNFIYVLLIGVLCLTMFSEEFFRIMTSPKFYGAFWYVPMIIIGVYSASVNMLYSTIITAREATKVNAIISMVGAIISVCLNVALLPHFGLVVAALVSSLAMTIMLLLSVYFSKIRINQVKHIFSLLTIALTIYLFVYSIHFDNMIISITIKSGIIIFVVGILSLLLSINPVKAINNFIKKQ